ncbi:hypothetical protein DPX16_22316 [Anabarilius grahami]|uniref:Uncharacterized protein n=1 Tax=Anabarilius grahami TaxID=495550 RepID=A0A3N0Y8K0_ANAGA|nr:hypothetical protein DPX16_22316 [Anabarilius grahami]
MTCYVVDVVNTVQCFRVLRQSADTLLASSCVSITRMRHMQRWPILSRRSGINTETLNCVHYVNCSFSIPGHGAELKRLKMIASEDRRSQESASASVRHYALPPSAPSHIANWQWCVCGGRAEYAISHTSCPTMEPGCFQHSDLTLGRGAI